VKSLFAIQKITNELLVTKPSKRMLALPVFIL